MERWNRESTERHEQEVADGKHDEQCEFGPRLMSTFGQTRETFFTDDYGDLGAPIPKEES